MQSWVLATTGKKAAMRPIERCHAVCVVASDDKVKRMVFIAAFIPHSKDIVRFDLSPELARQLLKELRASVRMLSVPADKASIQTDAHGKPISTVGVEVEEVNGKSLKKARVKARSESRAGA